MGKLYFSFYVAVFFVFVSTTGEAQTIQEYLAQSDKYYFEGKTESAIANLEKVLEIDKNHLPAKMRYELYLNEVGTKYYSEKNYTKAAIYLGKLMELSPDRWEIKAMYEKARQEAALKKKAVAPTKKKAVAPAPTPVPSAKDLKKEKKRLEEITRTVKSQFNKERKVIEEFKGEQKKLLENIISRMENNSNALLLELKAKNKQMLLDIEKKEAKLKKTYTYGFVVGLFCLFLLTGFVIMRRKYESKYQARLLRQYEQKIITKILPEAIRRKADTIPETRPRETIKTPLKQLTTEKKIEMIKAIRDELSETGNAKLGINLLRPFLDDINISVRLEALRVLYDFDKSRSLKVLESLAEDKDPTVRLQTVTILGEIMTTESVSILLSMVYDTDINVRKVIMKKLNEIKDKGTISSEYFNEKLKYLLEEIRKKERWIIG